jgi:thymidylate synthase (FAD)
MHPGLLSEIAAWPYEKKLKELEYMANTIPSSWEFVDYTFMVEGVTRAFTHQFVRSRQFSFAQQTMRVLDVSSGPGWDYLTGPSINENERLNEFYEDEMTNIDQTYKDLIANGAKIEDARGILPTNILTNIVGKCNMRTFVELVRKRSSPRTQSEYRDVLDAMKAAVREVHPWIDLFIDRNMDKAIADLQAMIDKEPGDNVRTEMTKLLDQIRAQS